MRLIIDCDPGNGVPGANVDDGLALALALAAKPQLELELISIVAGNTPRELGFAAAGELLRQTGYRVPLALGAARALIEPPAPWRAHLDRPIADPHLASLWDGVPRPQAAALPDPDAAIAIGELICNNPGEITLAAIGPLTNVAQALQLYPQMAQAVKEIVIMGGVFNVEGYIKDTNFGLDPEAARRVLSSGANITLAPLDVTTQTMLTQEDLARLTQPDTPLCRYLRATTQPWIDYSRQTRHLPGCWIHDALVIAWLLEPQLVTTEEYFVDVALEGAMTRGSSRRWQPGSLRLTVGMPEPQGKPVRVMQQVDNARLLALIGATLARG
ncbi:nucleoside hydrolase [Serratia entomophila]|uniref:nucleoside hydrolase n=1 Tax=Serratia entomophila TaxID=42906 RepID=UPI00217875BA|nr:nucleoside hydrolase [Serratia entomophila]CAI1134285.1 Pyrimidine-specific ribonucleoside hydrolase rihB [Serratia entomophila]CAI1873630.1 Pyrimidine-specific ribonucleoside hydrolase rihB [Serratia entomophila]CAI1877523.1 Pyrimidine-specific ribonucleoside hydrolase rihB [Serratia entomophila]CAI1931928.1 Pyrimidine-specific ribonucleoside hydrolase rihB [Serratia entomophila]CAI1963161.1 Pyrimidine-specific ribonucleoside hydrolase rihB [Serratia entomophila]